MTKWKDEIDKALGIDPKFSEALQKSILNKATKRTFHWRYAVTAISFVLVALLLFLTGPTQIEQKVTAVTPFDQLIEQSKVEQFFISSAHTEPEQFLARDSSRYMNVQAFKDAQEINAMQHFLMSMKLVESSESLWDARDVIVVMSNGERLKLKIAREPKYYIVQDVYTKLMYNVAHTDSQAYDQWYEEMEHSTLSIGTLFLILAAIIGLAFIADRLLKNPNSKRQKRSWKSIALSIMIVVLINGYLTSLRTNAYVMHIDVHFMAIALLTIGTQFFVQKEGVPLKKQLLSWFMIALVLLLLWSVMNFG